MKATLTVDVEFDPEVTDAESIASAADRLLKTALSIPDVEEYANPRFAPFFVAPSPNQSAQSTPIVVVEISGGALQAAYVSDTNTSLRLVDWDTDGSQPDADNDVVAVIDENGRSRFAVVAEFSTARIDQLPTVTRQAIERAGLWPGKQPEVLRRFVLYDMDTDALLRTKLYSDYDEAAGEADRCNDVLVLPLEIQSITL